MSLMGTLAKVAIGVAMAKGAKSVLAKKSGGTGGGGGAFGGSYSPGNSASQDRNVLGDLLGGGQSGGNSGGLGGLLEGLSDLSGGGSQNKFDDVLHQPTQSGSAGGLGDLIGSLTGGQAGGAGGGLGGLLGTLAGAAGAGGAAGGFGELLNQSLQQRGEPKAQPTGEQDAAAGLMLRAMIQAAKSDGKIDDAERAKLLENLGEVSQAEREFVTREMAAPVDPEGLARQTPNGMQQQVYAMSLLGIDLDNQTEAQYLHSLATAMGLDQNSVNHIHTKLGAPTIY